jgi:phage repressor protein C with HTH and peptisase S24 domain
MPVSATHTARFSLLQLELRGSGLVNAGVLLEDPATNKLHVRLRTDWDRLAPQESDVLGGLEAELMSQAEEMGAARAMEHFCNTWSNTVRLTDPREVVVDDFDRALSRLYREHVASTVRPFVTHLPRYSLAVAAGKFLENQEVVGEAWEEVRSRLRLDDRMFVSRIVGHSMEPRIPDGSLCVFRSGVTGSREGRLVLVEALGTNDRYTVKRYHSEKRQRADGTWEHERIRLEPLNPEFEAWDLDPEQDRFRIVAEFVEVLD